MSYQAIANGILSYQKIGDIVGTGTGKASKPVGFRRYTPDGRDEAGERERERQAQQLAAPFIAEAINQERELGVRLLAMGKRAANAALGYILEHRSKLGTCEVKDLGNGVVTTVGLKWITIAKLSRLPSDASVVDAASDATARLCECVKRHLASGKAIPFDNRRVRFFLGGIAWRAALASLRKRGDGIRGRKAESVDAIPLSDAELQTAKASLESWANGERQAPLPMDEHTKAKRDVSAWFWDVLVKSATFGLSAHQRRQPSIQAAIKAAKARAVLLIRLVYGDSFPLAAKFAGFESGDSAIKSLTRGKIAEQLAQAAKANCERLPSVRRLYEQALLAVIAARQSVKRERLYATLDCERRSFGKASLPLGWERARLAQRSRQALAWREYTKRQLSDWRESVAKDFGSLTKGLWTYKEV